MEQDKINIPILRLSEIWNATFSEFDINLFLIFSEIN